MTPIMTSDQVAAILGCKPGTIDDYAREKKLPATKIGGSWVFTMNTLLAFINKAIANDMRPFVEKIKSGRRPENIAHHAAKRRAVKKQRLAAWADHAAIEKLYTEALRLSKETGVPHHVDHIIPMQGTRVSGLHVENNLQVITAIENMKKHNRFDIEEQT